MGVQRFEDLIAWQKARRLSNVIYDVSRNGSMSRDYRFASQFQSAAVSAMSNIAEGSERGTPREFQWFLAVAKGSAAEVRSLLYIASDIKYLTGAQFDEIMSLAQEVSRLVGALRASAARRARRNDSGSS